MIPTQLEGTGLEKAALQNHTQKDSRICRPKKDNYVLSYSGQREIFLDQKSWKSDHSEGNSAIHYEIKAYVLVCVSLSL